MFINSYIFHFGTIWVGVCLHFSQYIWWITTVPVTPKNQKSSQYTPPFSPEIILFLGFEFWSSMESSILLNLSLLIMRPLVYATWILYITNLGYGTTSDVWTSFTHVHQQKATMGLVSQPWVNCDISNCVQYKFQTMPCKENVPTKKYALSLGTYMQIT